MIIIMGFGENNVLGIIYIDMSFTGRFVAGLHGSPNIFCLLFIKTEKVQEHDAYLNQILHHFYR